MVIFQGVLGGLRVVLIKLDLAIVHACVAQAFFCLATLAAMVTSRWWIESPAPTIDSRGQRVITLAIAACSCVYLQLIVGAIMRHYQAGLAIPDIPFAYGQLLPPSNIDQINQMRIWKLDLPAVTMAQVWLHFGHRIGAVIVSTAVVSLTGYILTKMRHIRALLVPAILLIALLLTQLTLGIVVVLWRKPADITSIHVAVGALCLLTTFWIAIRSMRLYRFNSQLRPVPTPRGTWHFGATEPQRT